MNKLFLAMAVGASLMFGGMAGAQAHDRGGHGWKQHHHFRHHHHHHHDHWRGRIHVGPPVAYYPRYYSRAYVYAPPPPVVYPAPVYVERPYYPRPGVTISVPPVFIGF